MSVSGRAIKLALVALLISFFSSSAQAVVAEENQPIHHSGDKEVWDRKTNRIEIFGHAKVTQPGETLTADYIVLDQNLRTLDAHGNCVYAAEDTVIYGEEMHFNLDTRTGTIVSGRVSNDRFTLGGERINKLGEGRFQTHWGEYSTCRDCAQSWTLQAQDVDMQVEGYAYLSNVAVKVKDAPSMWFPYLIVPMKTRRQSGLLFPEISISQQNGFAYVQPFFWAISRSADMTFGLGEYTEKGARLEWQGRYALTSRSSGEANFYFVDDSTFTDPVLNPQRGRHSRWGLNLSQSQELPFGIDEKLKIVDFSDDFYPYFFQRDFSGFIEKDAISSLSFSHSSSEVSAFVVAKRIRNLLDANPDATEGIRRFDPTTVQLLPGAVITTNDQLLFGLPIATGLTLGLANFTRTAGAWDPDTINNRGSSQVFRPNVDVLREATRFSVTPSIYAALRPWDAVSFTPSAKYFGNFYSFHNVVDNWYQSYVLFQADLSTQLEKIYNLDDPDHPRMKHLIRPFLTYSTIPDSLLHQEAHPFKNQIYGRSPTRDGSVVVGNYFDNADIVPRDSSPNISNYYLPLGHTVSFGLTTQLIKRNGKFEEENVTYGTPLEWTMGSAFNFREHEYPSDPGAGPRPWTRVFSTLNLNYNDRFTSGTTYYYYPYGVGNRHQITTTATYILERSLHQRILNFDRSVNMAYSFNRLGCTTDDCAGAVSSLSGGVHFSLSDYILPSVAMAYDLLRASVQSASFGVQFQSPSQCWKFSMGRVYSLATQWGWQMDASVNLTGSGFGGATEVITQATANK